MKKYISNNKKVISLPVPLGTTVYQVNTTCGDFCLFQKENFNNLVPYKEQGRCSNILPCHTIGKEPREIELNINNLSLLNEWEKTIFESYNEAKDKTKELVHKNIKYLKNNNILIDEKGYSKNTSLSL